ncbi:MAG: PAS domain S-box protein, partial [Candidatus Omnitrophica bacterium]|nr:PAS domain S-box protein [Candidatus Omnitrophota bacterium]
MRIFYKLILSFLLISLLIWVVGFFAIKTFQKTREQTVAGYTHSVAAMLLAEIDQELHANFVRLTARSKGDTLQRTIQDSNKLFEKMADPENFINRMEQEWLAVPGDKVTPFIQQILDLPLSKSFRQEQTFYLKHYGYSVFPELFVTNQFGTLAAASNKTSDYRQNDEAWWTEAWGKGSFLGPIEFDQSSKTFSIAIATRVENDLQEPIGVFKGVLDLRDISDLLSESEKNLLFKGTRLSLFDSTGRYVFPPSKFGKEAEPFLKKYLSSAQILDGSDFTAMTDDSGHARFFVAKQSTGTGGYLKAGWTLIVSYDRHELFEPNRKVEGFVFLVSGIAMLLSLFVGLFLAISFSRPLEKLRRVADRFGMGDFSAKVGIESKDEFGAVARDFESMAESLKTKTTSIENLDREIEERKLLEKVSLENSQFLQKLMDSMPNPVFYKDISGVYIGCNRAFEAFFGKSQKEIVGKKAEDIFLPEVAKIYQEKDVELFAIPGIQVYEASVKDANGDFRDIVFHKATFTGPNGEVEGIIGVIMDVTLRKRAEEAREASQKFLSTAINSIPDIFYVFDAEGNLLLWNEAFEQVTGYSSEEVSRMRVVDFFDEPGAIRMAEAIRVAFEKGFNTTENNVRTKDGRKIPVFFSGSIAQDLTGRPVLCGIGKDITERKQAEEAIKASVAELKEAQRVSHVGSWVLDLQTEHTTFSDEMFRIYGMNPAAAGPIFQECEKMMHPEDWKKMMAAIKKSKETGEDYELELRITRPDGEPRVILSRGHIQRDSNDKAVRLSGISRDITERKRAEEALIESEKRFIDVIYASQDAILLIDGDTFVDCNEATARMLGYATREEFLMSHPSRLSPPQQPNGRDSFEEANEMMKLAFERGFHRFEWIHRKANG